MKNQIKVPVENLGYANFHSGTQSLLTENDSRVIDLSLVVAEKSHQVSNGLTIKKRDKYINAKNLFSITRRSSIGEVDVITYYFAKNPILK